MIRPSLKKNLSPAWDLAFSWLQDEPHVHHPALPLSVLLAMSTLSLLWGWPTEAAIWLMTWIGLLRIGEVLEAVRSDLLLPRDSAPGIEHILLRIREPKTRGRGARHQSTIYTNRATRCSCFDFAGFSRFCALRQVVVFFSSYFEEALCLPAYSFGFASSTL